MRLSPWAPVAFFLFATPALSQSVATVKYVAAPVMILRPGSLVDVKPGDALRADDVLVTGPNGRARIILLDASEVTLSPRTEVRVAIHDPQKQQTLIEMLHGRVRTKVTPVTKQGGFFKVATPTAIAYALGSELVTETISSVLVETFAFFNTWQRFLDKYAKENGFSMVLDAQFWPGGPILWASGSSADVTGAIVSAYNSQQPAAPAAPASSAPATSQNSGAGPSGAGKP